MFKVSVLFLAGRYNFGSEKFQFFKSHYQQKFIFSENRSTTLFLQPGNANALISQLSVYLFRDPDLWKYNR
jgi:hypothetical protein